MKINVCRHCGEVESEARPYEPGHGRIHEDCHKVMRARYQRGRRERQREMMAIGPGIPGSPELISV